ncbi:LemA family protein [bacterium]|nr:LemA family protein [bacterium]
MKKSRSSLIIIGALVVIGFILFRGYNGLVDKEETVNNAWADVQTQYQRRADLIPNLVSTVKGYAEFEKETLESVINARANATSTTIDANNLTAEELQKFQAAQTQVSSALSRLLVTVERYPDLKANQNFLELQTQLERTENRINRSRELFNESAKAYNSKIRKFPTVIIASVFGFDRKAYFDAQEGAEQAPEVGELLN